MSSVIDRRRTPRVGLPARAFIRRLGSDEPIEFGVRDLSAGGGRLVGHVRLKEFEHIRLNLELDGAIVSLSAEVVRADPQNMQVAVTFRDVPPATAELIERSLAAFLESVRTTLPPTVLVHQVAPAVYSSLERDLAQLGRRAKSCATRLEVIWALNEPTARCEAIVICADADARPELLQALAEDHPHVRRLVLFVDKLGSLDHASSSRVDGVLRTPWRLRPLARALGIESADSSVAMLPPE
jgi:hypothetical protein